MTNRKWVTLHFFLIAMSWHLVLWPTECEWHNSHCTFFWKAISLHHLVLWLLQNVSYIAHFSEGNVICHMSCNQQNVSDIAHFSEMQSQSYMLSYDQQQVSDITETQSHHILSYNPASLWVTLHSFLKGNVIISCPMANSWWVTKLHIAHFKDIDKLILYCPITNRKWETLHIFLKGNLIASCPMTNRKWVSLNKGNLITSCPMNNSLWVTLPYMLVKGNLITSCPTMTNSWWMTSHSVERQSHHIFYYDQQKVSDSSCACLFLKGGNLITSCAMANRKWVTLHILCKAIPSHLVLWPTVCEWHCTCFWKAISSHLVLCMTNRKWVTLDILLKGNLLM